MIVVTLTIMFLLIFQCLPVKAMWDLDARKTAKCLDIEAVGYVGCVVEIVTEVVLFLLPVPIIHSFTMAKSKKVQLICFFGAGIALVLLW